MKTTECLSDHRDVSNSSDLAEHGFLNEVSALNEAVRKEMYWEINIIPPWCMSDYCDAFHTHVLRCDYDDTLLISMISNWAEIKGKVAAFMEKEFKNDRKE